MKRLITIIIASLLMVTTSYGATIKPEISVHLDDSYKDVVIFELAYNERMEYDINGYSPLPLRYLPFNYQGGYLKVDELDIFGTYMYEVVKGQPIFYRISRYSRPETFAELQNLPYDDTHKLILTKTGLDVTGTVGNLYLK